MDAELHIMNKLSITYKKNKIFYPHKLKVARFILLCNKTHGCEMGFSYTNLFIKEYNKLLLNNHLPLDIKKKIHFYLKIIISNKINLLDTKQVQKALRL